MSSPETVSESAAERDRGVTDRARSLLEPVAPELARQAESGNLAAASGVVSLVRAGRTFLRGNRKRGSLQALAGLFWVGVALAQRRSGAVRRRSSHSGAELSEVVDTSPDVEGAVEPGGRETDHATGEDVVDTTNADLTETPATEDSPRPADESPGVGDGIGTEDVETGDVDQRDVVGSNDLGDAEADRDAETEAGEGAENEADEDAETEADENAEFEASEDDETEIGESEEAALAESEESETAE